MVRWGIILLAGLIFAPLSHAQVSYPPIQAGTTVPATCTPTLGPGELNLFWDTDDFVLKYCSATNTWSSFGAGGGITTLNTLVATTQTFATPGTTGTAPNWVSATSTHTLHIPLAITAAVTAGLIAKTEFDTFNNSVDSVSGTANQIGSTAGQTPVLSLADPLTFPGNLVGTQKANGDTFFQMTRFTDTAPTGNFLNLRNAAAATLWKVDITGAMTSGTATEAGVQTLGGASSTTPSSIAIFGGDGAANIEPPYLRLVPSPVGTGDDTYLYSGGVGGCFGLSSAAPSADTTNCILDMNTARTVTNKTFTAADNVIEADTGDSATSFFAAGTLEDARLSTNVALYNNGTKTWGAAATLNWTFDAGAVDPVFEFTSGNVKFSGVTTYTYEGGATDPVWTPGSGTMNLSTGTLQEGAVAVSLPARSETLTEKTLNVESSNNVITTVSKIWIDAAACVAGTAATNWDMPDGAADAQPTAECNDTGTIQRPTLSFSGSAVNGVERNFKLPSDWTGNIDIDIHYLSTVAFPAGNVEWEIQTICRAVGETWDAAFNAAQTITDAQVAQNTINSAVQATLTTTTCAASEDFSIRIWRDGTNDTSNDVALMLGAEITIRRAQ